MALSGESSSARKLSGQAAARTVRYARFYRAMCAGARGRNVETPHYVETSHVMCVLCFHVVQSFQDHRLNGRDPGPPMAALLLTGTTPRFSPTAAWRKPGMPSPGGRPASEIQAFRALQGHLASWRRAVWEGLRNAKWP